jgi:hypothetical protein
MPPSYQRLQGDVPGSGFDLNVSNSCHMGREGAGDDAIGAQQCKMSCHGLRDNAIRASSVVPGIVSNGAYKITSVIWHNIEKLSTVQGTICIRRGDHLTGIGYGAEPGLEDYQHQRIGILFQILTICLSMNCNLTVKNRMYWSSYRLTASVVCRQHNHDGLI